MIGAGGGEFADGEEGAGVLGTDEAGAGEIGFGIALPLGRGRSSLSIPDLPPVLCAT